VEVFQLKLGVNPTPVAPLAGETSAGAGGAVTWVVNDQVKEVRDPMLFFATTRQ
jgi:hypothetical protein